MKNSAELLRHAVASLPRARATAPVGPNWRETVRKVRDHFDRYPILKPKYAENKPRVCQMEQEGMVFIENFLAEGEVAALAQRLRPIALDCAHGRLPEKYQQKHYQKYGRYRVFEIHKHNPEVMEIFAHPIITDLIQSYMSRQGVLKTIGLELRTPPPSQDAALGDLYPHFDHIYREVKIFLALEDIELKHGPMIYWTRTHLDGEWRRLPEYLFSLGGLWSNSHIMTEMAIDNLMEHHPEFRQTEIVHCTIPAGGLYIADTRGLHRAGLLEEGHRLQVIGEYSFKGYERKGVACDNPLQPLTLG